MNTHDPVSAALAALRAGRMVVVADDDDREAEGDFIAAASLIDDQGVNLMATHGRGLICCAVDAATAARLALAPAAGALHDTAFTESVDYRHGTTTGISCADRAAGLRALASPDSRPEDFARPGHLFPLVARDGGVLERRGHTEAAVDLCRLAGLPPAGVICEIMDADGTMARGARLEAIARSLGMPFLRVEDIARHRRQLEAAGAESGVALELRSRAPLPTPWGEFELLSFRRPGADDRPERLPEVMLLAIGLDQPADANAEPPLVRVHSACVTGELFGSLRCDCGPQLQRALELVGASGRGAVAYLPQEGRGIGLDAKLAAYRLQDSGLDTHDANLSLGHPADGRDYAAAAAALAVVGIRELRLLTNNPAKAAALEAAGIGVAAVEPLEVPATTHSRRYLETKRDRFGHRLTI